MIWWIIVAIVGIAVEAFTTQLISIWFSIGAIINLFLYNAHIPIEFQLIQFLITGVVLAIAFRPVAKRLMPKFKPLNTADGIIGKTGVVVDEKRIKVDNQSWKYRSDKNIPIGSKVKVIALNGVTLTVEKETEGES